MLREVEIEGSPPCEFEEDEVDDCPGDGRCPVFDEVELALELEGEQELEAMDGLGLLPVEVIVHILDFVTRARDVARCSVVCRTWNSIMGSERVWATLFETDFGSLKSKGRQLAKHREFGNCGCKELYRAAFVESIAKGKGSKIDRMEWAVRGGYAKYLGRLIENENLGLDDLHGKKSGIHGRVPISSAIASQDLDTVRLLLDNGVVVGGGYRKDISRMRLGRRRNFQSILWWAVRSGTIEIVEALLEHHDFVPQLEAQTVQELYCPIHESVRKATPATLKLLLSKVSPSKLQDIIYNRKRSPRGNSPSLLHSACSASASNIAVLKFLLMRAPDLLDKLDLRGRSPLHVAASVGKQETVVWLLDHGCKLHDSRKLLAVACKAHVRTLAKVILTSEPELIDEAISDSGRDPHPSIYLALSRLSSSTLPMINLLVKRGADVTRWGDSLWRALPANDSEIGSYRKEVVGWMLGAGALVTEDHMQRALQLWWGDNPDQASVVDALRLMSEQLKIDWATKEAHDKFLPFIAKSKVSGALVDAFVSDVNVRFDGTAGNQTLLHVACSVGQIWWRPTEVYEFESLLKRGADVNSMDDDGATPLHYCTRVSQIELLAKYGASVNAKTNDGSTWLHLMTKKPISDWPSDCELEKLAATGFDFDALNSDGQAVIDIVPAGGRLGPWLRARANP